ncbi:keratinocyte-associated protein 3-like, partial [Rhineura floridana]|uniref:keratinocyte-associated protein 3-like n=1 Tax=Rhineura floridana TaxID=261503 RepID=UPI002AC87C75
MRDFSDVRYVKNTCDHRARVKRHFLGFNQSPIMGRGSGSKAGHRAQWLAHSGISLVVLGHLTLVLGAIIHSSLLRHVAWPVHTITSEYAVANVVLVASGLLSVAAGVLPILVSRSFSHRCLSWILVVLALANVLISGACCMGLALAISPAVVNGGHHLFTGCNSSALPADARTVITNKCPFDTTRIYDTVLVLWLPSLLMAAVEASLSAWCCTASL